MKISEINMISPANVKECLHLLHENEKETRLLAGGTDAVVRMKEGKCRPATWINIKGIKELRYIREAENKIEIGPLTTHTDIVRSKLLQQKANVLVEASKTVGAVQIQNMGTLGGNMGTASPAGDTLPALYVLDAQIELSSLEGIRTVPVENFFTGPGKTIMKPNELITKIIIKPQQENEIGIFQKLGPRKAQSISIINLAVALVMGEQPRECLGGKIAFGSVAPTVVRAKKCEAMLTLHPLDDAYIANIAKIAWKEVMPISDIRATAAYRRDMATSLLERGLYRLMKRWDQR